MSSMVKVSDRVPQATGDVRVEGLPEEILSRLGPARIEAVVAWAWSKLRAILLEDVDRYCHLGLGIEPGWDWRMDMTIWEIQLGNELVAKWREPDGEPEGSPRPAGGEAAHGSGDGPANPVEPGRDPANPGQAAVAGAGEARGPQS